MTCRLAGVVCVVVVGWSTSAFGQTTGSAAPQPNVSPQPTAVQAAGASDRSGFTALAELGFGVQKDTAFDSTATGLAGVNLGIGGFVNPKLALLFRIAGTNAKHDLTLSGDVRQVSGVAGLSLQIWPSDRFNVEVGGGLGYWTIEDEDDQGFGLLLGASAIIFKSGNHGLHAGFQYSPAFFDGSSVHNMGVVLGYQYHR